MWVKIAEIGLLFFVLMIMAIKFIREDPPLCIKALIIIPGISGFFAMLISVVVLIWTQ